MKMKMKNAKLVPFLLVHFCRGKKIEKSRSLPSSLKAKRFVDSHRQRNPQFNQIQDKPEGSELQSQLLKNKNKNGKNSGNFSLRVKVHASCLHWLIYWGGRWKYQYEVILLVQSNFFTKPRRLIDKPATGKREGNDNPFFRSQGEKMFTSESEKNKTKNPPRAPPIIPLEFIPIHILENQGIRFEA
jgi:hypothetical protein